MASYEIKIEVRVAKFRAWVVRHVMPTVFRLLPRRYAERALARVLGKALSYRVGAAQWQHLDLMEFWR